jgi:hypothetical protein
MLKSTAVSGSRGVVLPAGAQREVEDIVERQGLNSASEKLGVSVHTLARVVAGFGLAEGTVTKIQAALEAR